jgi:hypothetical protein
MDRDSALRLLELSASAGEQEVRLRLEELQEKYETKISRAPTPNARAVKRSELEKFLAAGEVLLAARPGEAGLSDLPVAAPLGDDVHVPPPVAPTSHPAPSGSSAPAPIGPKKGGGLPPPPTTQVPPKGDKPKPQVTLPEAPPDDELPPVEDDRPATPPQPWWVKALAALLVCALLGGIYWAVMAYWIGPKKREEFQTAGVGLLNTVLPTISQMEPPARGDGTAVTEVNHLKARALSWSAVALGAVGRGGDAGTLVSDVENLVTPMTGQASLPDRCRLIAAIAGGRGDVNGATAALVALGQEREKELRGNRPADQNAAPIKPSIDQDRSRRLIAISQSRQGQATAALGTVNSIQDDECACQAMAEAVRQLMATGNGAEAQGVLQTIETRAKKITDPSARAPLLAFVAVQTQALLGADKAKKYIQEAISSLGSGSISNSGFSDPEAKKVLGDALLMPTRLRLGIDSPDEYRKRLLDIFAAASNLQGNAGALTRQPDFESRARIYAVLAVAWHEMGSRWFSGDAAEQAIDMIGKAQAAAEQAKPRTSDAGGKNASSQFVKDRAIAPVVAGLAQMGEFERAGQLLARMVESEPAGEAAESVAYHMGLAGMHEEGRTFILRTAEGEPRCRAAVALLYGLNQLPLEKWW